MSSDLSKFYSSVKAIKIELELISNCGQSGHVLDAAIVQKFLYYSISYVGGYTNSGDDEQQLPLEEWFSHLSDVTGQLFQRRSQWDQHQGLSPKNLISYLSNISLKLMGLQQQAPLEWQKLIWLTLLETMLLYPHHPSTGPEFISALAQQGYRILLTAVKKAKEAQSDGQTSLHLHYELYLLGAALTNLDTTGKSGDPLKLAKDFLYSYLSSSKSKTQKGSSADKCASQCSVVTVVEMAVVVYGLQPHDVAADSSLSFYTVLFRVALENDALCTKLLACEGNLFRFTLTEVTRGFPADGICAAMGRNSTTSAADTNVPHTVQSIVMSVLAFVREMKQITEEPHAGSNPKSAKKNETSEGSAIKLSLKDITSAAEGIQAMLKGSPRPISIAISDSLVVLVYSLPRSKDTSPEILLPSIKLISLAVDAFSRDICQCALKHGQGDLMNQRLHALGVAAAGVILLLDILLGGDDQPDGAEVKELADMLKSTLQALHCLVEMAGSKKVSCHELLYKSVFPVLKKSMSDIGIVGRNLMRQGLHAVAISLLSPLWPVTRMKELLPSIKHHVTLCESYLKTSQPKEAWKVIGKAVMIDASLVSEPVVKVLVKVLKQEPSLSVLKLFEPCQDDDKRLQLCAVVASRLSLTQSVPAMKQASDILRYLANHKGLSDTDRAMQRFYLAQTLWFEADDKTAVSEECLELLKKVTSVLLADASHQFDDILAQAAFLYWGMLNTLSHLALDDKAAEITPGPDALIPPPSQTSSPLISSSLRDASELDVMMQEATPALDFTPKRVFTMSKRAVISEDRSACQADSKTAEQVDSECLMVKATSCLKVWTAWFTSEGHKIAGDEGMLRMDTSLRFLQKIAELAVINYKTTVAVTALCRAHHLAALMKRPEVTRDVMQLLVVLIPQLGLQCAPAKGSSDVDGHSFLLDVPDFEQSANLDSLTAVATHHLKTGQLEKFVLARNLAAKIIDDSRRKGLRTCSIYTALAIINRLDAEFQTLPGSAGVPETDNSIGIMSHPLELAGESLKNIKTVVAFNLGEDFQSSGSKKPSLEFWQVIHEYLLSIKQYGNLCLHTGNVKHAKTYFTEGLTMARKCLLVTWCAIFSVCLLKLSLLYHDTTSEADALLRSAVNILKKHKLAVDRTEIKHIGSKTAAGTLTSEVLSRMFDDTSAAATEAVASYQQLCPCSCGISDSDLRSQLLTNRPEFLSSSDEKVDEDFKIVAYPGTCGRCFQPEVAQLCADLMSSQAEILWRNKGDMLSIANTVHSAVDSVMPLIGRSQRKYAGKRILTDSDMDMKPLPFDVSTDCLPAVDAVYKLAEVKWQDLCCRGCGEIDDSEVVCEIENLLDVVEREGRKMRGRDNSNVLVASALLMKSHLVYQPMLRVKVTDEEEDDVVYDSGVIEMAVRVAKKEKQYWDEKHHLWLNSPDVPKSPAGTYLAEEKIVNKKSGQTTAASSFLINNDVSNASDPNGGKIKIASNENGENRKMAYSGNGQSSKIVSGQAGSETTLVCKENGDTVEQVSRKRGNKSKICTLNDDKVKVSSQQNKIKAEVLFSQSAKKCKNTYSIYSDVEGIATKKPRVVLSEKQNIYSIDNIGVESPCLKDSVLKSLNIGVESPCLKDSLLKGYNIGVETPCLKDSVLKSLNIGVETPCLKDSVLKSHNIAVDSPCLKDSVLKGRNNIDKSTGERIKSSKSRTVPQLQEMASAESKLKTGLSKIPRTSRLSKLVEKKSEPDVVSKKENVSKAAFKSFSRDGSEIQEAMESRSEVLEKNGRLAKEKKNIKRKPTVGSVCDRLKMNQRERESSHDLCEDQDVVLTVEADTEEDWKNLAEKGTGSSRTKTTRKIRQPGLKSRRKEDKKEDVTTPVKDIKTRKMVRLLVESHDLFEDQDLALKVKTASGEVNSENDWKNLVEKSNESSRTKTTRKGRQPGLKNRRKEDEKEDVTTPVKDIKTRRTRRILCSVVKSPEAMRVFVDEGVHENRFHEEINAGGFRNNLDGDDDAGELDMSDEVTDVCQDESYTDILLSHSSFPPPVEIEMPDSFHFQENESFLTAENGHFSFSIPVEIPRGRPQRRRPEVEVPDKGVSQSGKMVNGRGRARTVKKQPLEVSFEVDEKENILLETDDLNESLPVIRDVRLDKGSEFINGKTVNLLQSSVLSLSSAESNSQGQTLQESRSPNIANQSGVRKPVRQKVPKKDGGKQTAKSRKTVDLTSEGLCIEEEAVVKTREMMSHSVRDSVVDAGGEVDLQALVRKFPSLAYSHSATTRIKYLYEALAQLVRFPHSILYRQICRTLAMCLWEHDMIQERPRSLCSGQREIAAYLTESMHITFQHLLAKNLHYKLRKSSKSASENSTDGNSQINTEVEREAMQASLNTLTFEGDVMTRFTDRLKSLPGDWTVGQISIADFDVTNPGRGQVFVTRVTSHLEPLTVGIPLERCQFLDTALRVYEEAVVFKVENLTPEQHWKHRHLQDDNMQNLIYYLQELFLAGHRWLLHGQLAWVREPSVRKLLDETAQDTVAMVQQLHGCHVCYSSVRNLLEVLLQANEREITSLVECLWPPPVASTVAQACMNVQRSAISGQSVGETRGPLVLILDNKLNKIPWESMPDLFSDTVTRIPSLATLSVMVTVHKKQVRSPFHSGVDRSNVVALIPPDTDLQNVVNFLAPQFQTYRGWTCHVQKVPTISELKTFLTDHSLYLYCGHSWGNQYVGGRDVQLIRGQAVAILMGCSSAKLDYRRHLDGDGGPLYYILAGCPAVMGNLWVVTDKDIDKLTSQLFSQWLSQDRPVSLSQLLVSARKACRLHGLTGFAPVVYGLPVMMN